jgi:transposase InsO family protein
VEPDLRDQGIDFINHWSTRTGSPLKTFFKGLGLAQSKYYSWKDRYGMDNLHNGKIPRDHWLEDWEREAIVEFAKANPEQRYRALTYKMLDEDIVAATPATVYRVLKQFGLIRSRWNEPKTISKGKGFSQPLLPHEHWHTDISYLNICGTFYYLITVLDGCSRYVVHWEIRQSMTEHDVELVLQRAKELFPAARPRIITDNGTQFISRDFKDFIRISGMSHVRTSPNYPQSNGKLERYHRTLKADAIRPNSPLSIDEARRTVLNFVTTYNYERLHSALGFVTPYDKLVGRHLEIFAARDRKLDSARARRKAAREINTSSSLTITDSINSLSEPQLFSISR